MSFGLIDQIAVSYDKKNDILKDFTLEIYEGELLSLLGPSGCGKSTTLRVIAGFIYPHKGTFTLDGKDLTKVPVHKRNFGMVFQSYALFPHLNVEDNIAFGLKIQKVPLEERKTQVAEIVERTGLQGLEKRFPKQLSGGQRQRVALARALVTKPKLLLLDEPLSNLDAQLRLQMRTEIKRIQKELGITTVFVTHDQEECFSISDRVAIMNQGKIEQCDTPEVIYHSPQNEYVARFVGFENFLEVDEKGRLADGTEVPLDKASENSRKLCIRAEDLEFTDEMAPGVIPGTLKVSTYLGRSYQYVVETAVGDLIVNSDQRKVKHRGEEVFVSLNHKKIIFV